MFVCIMFKDI